MRLLIVEDDAALGPFLCRGLQAGAEAVAESVELATDGEQAVELFVRREPDLLLLDLDLPVLSGLEVLSLVRNLSPVCPVLVLSGRAETRVRIACLEAGADDCMQKPFSLAELRARCQALLRRRKALHDLQQQENGALPARGALVLEAGPLRLDRVARQVQVGDQPLRLTNIEFRLAEQLLLGETAPVERETLREAIWGRKQVETNALDVHVAALRRKLEQFPGAPAIETVRGSGYRLRTVTNDAQQGKVFSATLPVELLLPSSRPSGHRSNQ